MISAPSIFPLILLPVNPRCAIRFPLSPFANGDKGKRIAQRGFTGNKINGNIEGAEIIYNEAQNKYYLFIAYDWLSTKYNVRVARGDNPDGPFNDYNNV